MLRNIIVETKKFFKIFLPLTLIIFIPIYFKRALNFTEGVETFVVAILKGYLVYMAYVVVSSLMNKNKAKDR